MKPNIKIGYGYDVHRLEEGHPFWLGGIKIDHTHGAVGHSDADVLIHAICDALLGAANLRDIGYHFPDTDARWRGVDSKLLLAEVMQMIRHRGYELGNLDSTICLQKPKINPYMPQMQSTLAAVMQVATEDVAIKATTTEKLGFVGKSAGVSAHASVLIYTR